MDINIPQIDVSAFYTLPNTYQEIKIKASDLGPRQIKKTNSLGETGFTYDFEGIGRVSVVTGSHATEAPTAVDPKISALAEARIALMAREDEDLASREDMLRIAMLTERMRALVPRVTPAHINAIAETADLLEKSAESLAKIKARFSLG